MAYMSKRFNFDEFDKLCAEALEEDAIMAEQDRQREEEQAWEDHDRVFLGKRPGEIGSVVTRLSWQDGDPLASPIEPVTDWPEPPDAA